MTFRDDEQVGCHKDLKDEKRSVLCIRPTGKYLYWQPKVSEYNNMHNYETLSMVCLPIWTKSFYAGFYCDLLRGILEKVNLCKCQHQQTEDNSDGVLLDEKPYS